MKKFNLEFVVGLFLIAGFSCFVYLALQLGEVSFFAGQKNYTLAADFDNVSGLKEGAVLEIAGVNVGKVDRVVLGENDRARVYMQLPREIVVYEDAVASVRTQGIIGDKYIRIIQGGADETLQDGDFFTETESALDIEEMVGKYIFGDL
ncbi:MAG: outer membrane lipid asymmetry maintenance protein MlaD [Desulfurivibrionaceae bacterium]|nr:outer membrane lipid asymmetry maintenance protein MlaD [Desulfobulbales bacterium]MDT8334540.1 outer membrane lipid asymmetry maintenance protein MlaD [Desulfurivibrionaceae bacterium]